MRESVVEFLVRDERYREPIEQELDEEGMEASSVDKSLTIFMLLVHLNGLF